MKYSINHRLVRGFTLVEVLVVIAILIILAALGFKGFSSAMETARIAQNTDKIRGLTLLLGTYASEFGHYPPGWDGSYDQGPSDQSGNPMSGRAMDLCNAWQEQWSIHEGWLSPTVEGRLIGYGGNPNRQPTNYTGHPRLLYNGSNQGPPLAPMTVQRPSEVFLLCDGVPKVLEDVNDPTSAKNAQTGMKQWYQYHEAHSDDSELPISTARSSGKDSNGPDFRNRGKCHVAFCDGHVESFEPEDFKQKHVSLAY